MDTSVNVHSCEYSTGSRIHRVDVLGHSAARHNRVSVNERAELRGQHDGEVRGYETDLSSMRALVLHNTITIRNSKHNYPN